MDVRTLQMKMLLVDRVGQVGAVAVVDDQARAAKPSANVERSLQRVRGARAESKGGLAVAAVEDERAGSGVYGRGVVAVGLDARREIARTQQQGADARAGGVIDVKPVVTAAAP